MDRADRGADRAADPGAVRLYPLTFVDGDRITPGSEGCRCTIHCEWPCWQRIGLTAEPCCPDCAPLGDPTVPCPRCDRGRVTGPNGESWRCSLCDGTGMVYADQAEGYAQAMSEQTPVIEPEQPDQPEPEADPTAPEPEPDAPETGPEPEQPEPAEPGD